MDYCNRKELIERLEEKLASTSGLEHDSIQYRVSMLRLERPANCYSMSSELSRAALDGQIAFEKRILEGLVKIRAEQLDNVQLREKIEAAKRRLYHLEMERPHCGDGGYSEFEKISGRLVLDVKKVEYDPSFDVGYIDFSVNRVLLRSMPVGALDEPAKLEFQRAANISVSLVSSDRQTVFGMTLLPSRFFERHAGEEVILCSSMFNFVTLAVEFERCQIINQSNRKFECYVVRGHAFNRVPVPRATYCNVCHGSCTAGEDAYACIKCRVRCHVACARYILFKCLADKIYFGESDFCGQDEMAMGASSVETQQVHPVPNLDRIRIREEKYDIAHDFRRAFSWGFRRCAHCGERIGFAAGMVRCVVCRDRYHCGCQRFVFNSCGIEYELRAKMVEFQRDRMVKLQAEHQLGSIADLRLLGMIGKGSFGKVLLVQERTGSRHYALKVIKKQNIYSHRDLRNVETEQAILRMAVGGKCPFLVSMHFCFQDKYRIYMGLDYVSGGELRHWLARSAFPEARVRCYTVELVKALEFLHRHNVAYRDLKLDNILLAEDGHVKLCDFGLSKLEMGPDTVTYTYCGSLDTVAPEVLGGEGYMRSVDFWSLGVVVYEMMHRRSPFTGSSIEELADAIRHTKLEVQAGVSPEAKDFVHRLLCKEPPQRLGYGPEAFFEIKSHPWFADVDWDRVCEAPGCPEFVPAPQSVCASGAEEESSDAELKLTPAISVADLHKYIEQYEELDKMGA